MSDKVVLFETLRSLSVNRPAIKHWIRKKPHCIVEVIKTAHENLKHILASGKVNVKSYQYLLALPSVGTLANVLSTKQGLKFVMRVLPTYHFFDLLILTCLFLDTGDGIKLKKEILRCLNFAMDNTKMVDYFRQSDTLYNSLKRNLKSNDDIVETTLSIIRNLFTDIKGPQQALHLVDNLPNEELKGISTKGKGYLKRQAKLILEKAVDVRTKAIKRQERDAVELARIEAMPTVFSKKKDDNSKIVKKSNSEVLKQASTKDNNNKPKSANDAVRSVLEVRVPKNQKPRKKFKNVKQTAKSTTKTSTEMKTITVSSADNVKSIENLVKLAPIKYV